MKKSIAWGNIAVFVVYLVFLGYLLFFSQQMGRTGSRLDVNLVPFRTIQRFWNAWLTGKLGLYPVALNLIGNFVAFMPFGWFFPRLHKHMRHFLVFFLTMLLLVFAVEMVQVLLRCGSGDVDDILLNVGGALVAWFIALPFWRQYKL